LGCVFLVFETLEVRLDTVVLDEVFSTEVKEASRSLKDTGNEEQEVMPTGNRDDEDDIKVGEEEKEETEEATEDDFCC
jgi:uncharacterized membrane protein YukC